MAKVEQFPPDMEELPQFSDLKVGTMFTFQSARATYIKSSNTEATMLVPRDDPPESFLKVYGTKAEAKVVPLQPGAMVTITQTRNPLK